jgi:predicted thioesterase
MPRAGESPVPTAAQSLLVEPGHLASALDVPGELAFPDVFATSRMIGLMEVAAARCLLPLLDDGEMSVGVSVDVRHIAPTPPGATVTATARFVEVVDGKLYRFEVVAADGAGEVGRGTHDRAIVKTAKLLARAAGRG